MYCVRLAGLTLHSLTGRHPAARRYAPSPCLERRDKALCTPNAWSLPSCRQHRWSASLRLPVPRSPACCRSALLLLCQPARLPGLGPACALATHDCSRMKIPAPVEFHILNRLPGLITRHDANGNLLFDPWCRSPHLWPVARGPTAAPFWMRCIWLAVSITFRPSTALRQGAVSATAEFLLAGRADEQFMRRSRPAFGRVCRRWRACRLHGSNLADDG